MGQLLLEGIALGEPFQVEVGFQFERKRAEDNEEEDSGDLECNQCPFSMSEHFSILEPFPPSSSL